MRVIYADTGLWHDLGHHANACRLITREWRARGHDVTVAASNLVDAGLRAELGAVPHFRVNTYWGGDNDPICGWLTSFFHSAARTAEDLTALGPFAADDLLYVNSIMPAQLMALANFMAAAETRPQVIAELGTGPGLDFEWREGLLQFSARDTRQDSRAVLYRFAGRQFGPGTAAGAAPGLHLFSFDRTCSAIYTNLLGRDVHTLPLPHHAPAPPLSRAGRRPVTIGILGHQRGEKGFHLVPAIAAALLHSRHDIRLLLHNGAPAGMPEAQAALHALAAADARITMDERVAGPGIWQELLDRSDLIVCPYHPPSYIGAYSAIVAEALAEAVPLVVPGGTTLARTVGEFGGPGVAFEAFEPVSIVAAIETLLADFDAYAHRAHAAAAQWRATMGAARMVDACLALLPASLADTTPRLRVA